MTEQGSQPASGRSPLGYLKLGGVLTVIGGYLVIVNARNWNGTNEWDPLVKAYVADNTIPTWGLVIGGAVLLAGLVALLIGAIGRGVQVGRQQES